MYPIIRVFVAVTAVCLYGTDLSAQACCCTGAGANYSILPNINRHVAGLRYTHSEFFPFIRHNHKEHHTSSTTNAYLNSIELFGRFNLTERVQFSVMIPVGIVRNSINRKSETIAGTGDMNLLFQYQFINPLLCTGKKARHQFRLGVGTKLPTGHFELDTEQPEMVNLQTGTGSVDFVVNSIYTFRFNNFGFNALAVYKLNTANSQGYNFGSKTQAGINFFYLFHVKEVQLMPSAGFNYEYQADNRYRKVRLSGTGSSFLTASAGFDIYYKQFAFSSSVAPSVVNFYNRQGKPKLNFEVGLFYNFSITKSQIN